MRKIVYEIPGGGIAVVHPVRNTYPRLEKFTDAEIEQRAWDKLPKDAISPRFINEEQIPLDRTFRNAWVMSGNDIGHDMEKAREIHKNRLREMRAPKLAALDAEYMRADEVGDSAKKAEIASRKQVLRDVTRDPAITSAKTPEELKAFVPSYLA